MIFSTRRILILALLAGSINCIPRLLGDPGADAFFHYTLIHCFSSQFWQGDLYPRWCMDANAGLGAPLFLFYFPLPYYITALLYPLHYFGGVETVYLAGIWLANVITFITCFRWLRDMVTPGRALLCAALFLFLPYRMELMLFRSAYAELWCVAFLPLLFLYARRMTQGQGKSWISLSWALIACLLCHIPATFIALIGIGIHALFAFGRNWKQYKYFIASVALALLSVTFYIAPAKFYMQYLHPDALEFVRTVWVNHYVTIADYTENGRARILITLGITLLFVIGVGLLIWLQRHRITDAAVTREVKAWLVISVVAAFLLFQVSAPLWAVLGAVSSIVSPWRVQALIMFAAIYLIAVKMQFLMSEKNLKTWKTDYGALLGLFALFSLFVLDMRRPELAAEAEHAIKANIVGAQEYRSRWVDEETIDPDHLMELFDQKPQPPKASISKGEGKAEILAWDWESIAVSVRMKTAGVLKLEQFYFPNWRMKINDKRSPMLMAEHGSGYMTARLSAGQHDIRIARDMAAPMGKGYWFALASTVLGLFCLIFLTWRRRAI